MKRFAPTILTALLFAAAVAAQERTERLLIRFTDIVTQEDIAAIEGAGAQIDKRFQIVPGVAARASASAKAMLAENPRIILIEQDSEVHAIDAELDASWGVQHIGAGLIHESGNKGTGVRVAVVDTGIDYTHSDLAANYAGGADFVDGDPPMDDHYHGTHCAGIVGAVDDGAGVVGVAPEVALYAVKVLNSQGLGYWSQIISGIEWCIANDIQVTSNSYGGSGYSALVEEAFQAAWDAGIFSVAAAGNAGNCDGTGNNALFPAKFESVIAIAATDKDNSRACWSSTGGAVELAAPGVAVYSTVLDGKYALKSGTSMATPHVAGLAALMIAAGNVNNSEIRETLQATAIDLGDAGRDALFGYGLIDAVGAVEPGPINYPPIVTIAAPADGASFFAGDSIEFIGTAMDQEDGDITSGLIWTSSVDGQIGQGGNFTQVLSEGVHVIAARVVDSGLKSGEAKIGLFVQPPPPPPTMVSIEWIAYRGYGRGKPSQSKLLGPPEEKRHFKILIRLVDENANGVQGAMIDYHAETLSGLVEEGTIITNKDGIGTAQWNNAPPGCYETDILNVEISGYIWDGVTPENGYCTSEVLGLLEQIAFFAGPICAPK